MSQTKVCVLGLGYIGLPTAAILATNGFQVVGVDTNEDVVDTLNNGDVHIEEPGLRTMVQAGFNSGNLQARSEPEEADVFVIAVPTPLRGKEPDVSYIESAAGSIADYLREGNLVINESTSPPKTTEETVLPILEESGLNAGKDFYLSYCPERVLPGSIMKELTENDRIIGGINDESAQKAREVYEEFVEGDIYLTDVTTAELVKVMENTYRDVNIALANELAGVAEELDADVWQAIELANKHPRVDFLRPGPGVGGHCIPIDPWFIIDQARDETPLLQLSRKINDGRPDVVLEELEDMLAGVANPKVTVLGVAYKGNVDDTRESPAVPIIQGLEKRGYDFSVSDPHVDEFAYEISDLEDALDGSDCALLITDHEEFIEIDPKEAGELMKSKKLFDTRNVLDHEAWEEAGFSVKNLGSAGNN